MDSVENYGEILVDSGANINIIRKGFLPLGLHHLIEKCHSGCILANDTKHIFTEKIELQIRIGDYRPISDTFFLIDESKIDVILSCNAMKASGVLIDLPLERLTIRDGVKGNAVGTCLKIGLHFLKGAERKCYLHVAEELNIPANTGVMLKVKTRLSGTLNVSKNILNDGSLIVPESIDTVNNGYIKIQILNLSETDQKLTCNKMLSEATSIEEDRIHALDRRGPTEIRPADRHKIKPLVPSDVHCGTNSEINELLKSLNQYRNICKLNTEKLEEAKVPKFNITLKPGTTPIYKRQYPTPAGLKEPLRKVINEMKRDGIIVPTTSLWNSPLFLVKKKGGAMRPVVDFRPVNQETVLERFPLPVISELFNSLNDCKYFTSMDLLSAYWQVGMEEEAAEKTAFTCPEGRYKFTRLPFGLVNAPMHFSKIIGGVLGELIGCGVLCYLDDIIIYSATKEEHHKAIKRVLEKLQEVGLQVKIEKSTFFQKEIKFLGHCVSQRGLQMDPDKLQGITQMVAPRSKKQLMSLMGMINYYRNFVEDFSGKVTPLTNLLSEKVDFQWGEAQEKAFRGIKTDLLHNTILKFPEYGKEFFIFSDASDYAIGGVLCQEESGRFRPISFRSKKLNGAELNYSVTKKEARAVTWCLQEFRSIILGQKIIVFTDHRPLVGIFGKNPPSAVIGRWVLSVQDFNMDLRYLSGKYNCVADALSRMPVNETLEKSERLDIECVDRLEDCVYSVHQRSREFSNFVGTFFNRGYLKQEQRKDNFCRQAARSVKSGKADVTDVTKFLIADGLLIRKRQLKRVDKTYLTLNIVLPDKLVEETIKWCHEHNLSGHQGWEKTLFLFRQSYFHPQEEERVQRICKQCTTCIKANGQPKKVPLKEYPVQQNPFSTVAIDLMGPLKGTSRGNKYIMVMVDHCTRFCLIEPLPNKTAEQVGRVLRTRLFPVFGCPKVLISDNGGEFINCLMWTLCDVYRITHRTTCPYHPASNGVVERCNGSIVRVLRCFLEDGEGDWDDHLPEVSQALNNRYHKSLQDTPHYALFGYDAYHPMNQEVEEDSPGRSPWAKDESSKSRLQNLRERVQKAIQATTQSTREQRNSKRKPKVLKEGDRVFIRRRREDADNRKLQTRCEGPFKIKALNDKGRVIVTDSQLKEKIVHEDDIIRQDEQETSDKKENSHNNKSHRHKYNLRERNR